MIVGDPAKFAIESHVTRAYARLSFRALGFFVIHISGKQYGIRNPNATMLACSFDEIESRISHRGTHSAPFATECDAGKIADAFRNAIYGEHQAETLLSIPVVQFQSLVHANRICWAPDGDEAFDDSSYILQFDHHDRVRLIGFKSGPNYRHDPSTLTDRWLSADEYYGVLQRWRDLFLAEWEKTAKTAESNP
jgi:hypothetical protein